MNRSLPNRAFTLIELLVVIAIIAILAAILFPVFAQARDKARSAACLSNVKQIALGVQMYAQDYDETLPVAGYLAQCRGRWQWQVYPYVKNQQVFTCPNLSGNPWSAAAGNYTCPNSATVVSIGGSDRGGYGWNYALQCNNTGNTDTSPGYSLASIAKSAETIIVGETGFRGTSGAAAGWAALAGDPRAPYGASFAQPGLLPQFRHNVVRTVAAQGGFALPVDGRANFAFIDGHAKNLNIGTAFEIAPLVGGVPTEDGQALVNESGASVGTYGTVANHNRPNIMFKLWNIF